MNRVAECFKKSAAIQKVYFTEYGREIAARNLQLMRTVGYAGTIVYVSYFVFTQIYYKEWTISPLYALVVPVLLFFTHFAKHALKAENINAKLALKVTFLLYIMLMLYVIIMSVFPHPTVPSAYYPLFLLMAPVLFILPAHQHLLMTVLSLALFYPLVLTFKSPACWSHELFEATTASIFSVIVIVFMTQFRIQSDSLKNKYYMLSRWDMLTGTANKSTGEVAAREYISALRPDERTAMLLVDIDDFKSFNDGYGHLEGDRLLKMIGSTLTALCRKDDIIYRFGGDEFVILLKDIPRNEVAFKKARTIIDAINKIDNNYSQPPSCSIGICFCDCHSASTEELVRGADTALYYAKSKGKNRFEAWSGEINLPKAGAAH